MVLLSLAFLLVIAEGHGIQAFDDECNVTLVSIHSFSCFSLCLAVFFSRSTVVAVCNSVRVFFLYVNRAVFFLSCSGCSEGGVRAVCVSVCLFLRRFSVMISFAQVQGERPHISFYPQRFS